MSLENILSDIAADLGLDITAGSDERTLAIVRVNQSAKELYEADDLIGSLREQLFDMGVLTQQVSLPYYVGEIRGCRYYDSRLHVTVHDMAPRYAIGIGNEVWPLQWRVLNNASPICQALENYSALDVSIPLPEDECFTITITGTTTNSHRATETLVFCPPDDPENPVRTDLANDLVKRTVNNWKSIESIKKSKNTIYDVTVTDVDGNIIAQIPNTNTMSRYVVLQILDTETPNVSSLEVLYKQRYFAFNNDEDEFCVGHNQYDKAIYWKYLEHECARNKDVTGALAAMQKCQQVVQQIANNAEMGIEKKINFGRCPYFNLSPFAVPMFSGKYYPRHVSH